MRPAIFADILAILRMDIVDTGISCRMTMIGRDIAKEHQVQGLDHQPMLLEIKLVCSLFFPKEIRMQKIGRFSTLQPRS